MLNGELGIYNQMEFIFTFSRNGGVIPDPYWNFEVCTVRIVEEYMQNGFLIRTESQTKRLCCKIVLRIACMVFFADKQPHICNNEQ